MTHNSENIRAEVLALAQAIHDLDVEAVAGLVAEFP